MENCRHCGSEDREFDIEDDSSSENIVQYLKEHGANVGFGRRKNLSTFFGCCSDQMLGCLEGYLVTTESNFFIAFLSIMTSTAYILISK